MSAPTADAAARPMTSGVARGGHEGGDDRPGGASRSPGTRRVGAEILARSHHYWLVVPLAGLVVFFSVKEPSAFLSAINLRSIAETAAPILILGVATTYVLAGGGIDLSMGSVVVFSGVVAQRFYEAHGGGAAGTPVVVVGVLLALVAGTAVGAINGVMIAVLRIPSLIATLAMMGAALGAAQLVTDGVDLTDVPRSLKRHVGTQRLIGVPLAAYIAGAITIVAAVFLFRSRFGLRLLGIGSDISVMERRGIDVRVHVIRTFALAGLLYGVVGILSLSRYSTTSINGHGNDALNAISATVIGGTSLFGGVATMFGTVLGVLIPAVLFNGLIIAGLPAFWQNIVIGVFLAVAVYLDQLQRRRRDAG